MKSKADKPRIRQNIYGQWKGYVGGEITKWFYDDQSIGGKSGAQQAREWLDSYILAHKSKQQETK